MSKLFTIIAKTIHTPDKERIAKRGKNYTLFKDREPQKTIPYRAAHTYIAHIWEYPPPPQGFSEGFCNEK